MASFYGNIKNNSRSSFIFDKIYTSRYAMETALKKDTDNNGAVSGDGVFINRYVLINYGYILDGYNLIDPSDVQAAGEPSNPAKKVNSDNYTKFYIKQDGKFVQATVHYNRNEIDSGNNYYEQVNFKDRYEIKKEGEQTSSRVENTYFATNRLEDVKHYNADYHLTVWMKIYSNNEERYIQVGRLKAEAPAIEIRNAAPSEQAVGITSQGEENTQNLMFADLLQSSDINYIYFAPNPWDIVLNGEHLPNYNQAGFSPIIQQRDISEDKIEFVLGESGIEYPEFIWNEIQLTPDTYIPNQYYIQPEPESQSESESQSEPKFILSTGDYVSGKTYYLKTQKYENGKSVYGKQKDQKILAINLPSIGNAVSDLYDTLYGQPNKTPNLLGYTNTKNYKTEEDNNEGANIRVKIGKISDDNNLNDLPTYYLTQDQIDSLWHNKTEYHDIPVYDTTQKRRPYTSNQLFNFTNIEPYNNIGPKDPVSMAWGIDEIKRYISELRFLSYKGHGIAVIGYTSDTDKENYSSIESPGQKHCLIDNNEYWLNQDQIASLRPNKIQPEYIIPVYEYLDNIGLQSDWTLDIPNSFGYIYHKPRMLWSNPEASEDESNSDYEYPYDNNYYSLHSIEYIYEHYNDEVSNDEVNIFGTKRNKDKWLNEHI